MEEIGRAVTNFDISLGSLTLEAGALTDFAWRAPYPGNPYNLAAGEVTAMLELAKQPARPDLAKRPNARVQ